MKGIIGMALEEQLRRWPHIDVVKEAKSSTGLARPDFFDWVKQARKLGKKLEPDVVICNLGPNDGQSLREKKEWHYWGTDSWREHYQRRVSEVMKAFPDAHFVWLGPPSMGSENAHLRQALLSLFIRSVVRSRSNSTYVDLFALTSDPQGNYVDTVEGPDGRPVRGRAGDGIHFKWPAARLFARKAIEAAAPHLGIEWAAPEGGL